MKKSPITKFIIAMLLLLVIVAITSCNKDNDLLQSKEFTSTITTIISELKFSGQNSGITVEGKNINTNFTNKRGPDSLILSQSPLIEFKYNIVNDVEYDITFTTNEVGDTTAIDTTAARVINTDTLSIQTGPIWLQFDNRNVSELLVGLNTPAIVDTLEVKIEIKVIDNVPGTSGLLFVAFGDGINDETIAATSPVTINSTRYAVIDSVPRFNAVGRIVRYTGGIKIPSFVTRQFQITNDSVIQRKFLLTMTSSSGSVITNEFAINFCNQETYINRQCWLSGDPSCQNLFP
jgi:hypothetical protein